MVGRSALDRIFAMLIEPQKFPAALPASSLVAEGWKTRVCRPDTRTDAVRISGRCRGHGPSRAGHTTIALPKDGQLPLPAVGLIPDYSRPAALAVERRRAGPWRTVDCVLLI